MGNRISSGEGPRTRERLFADLVRAARACAVCPRMAGRRRVLGWENGSLAAEVLFVAEAPGRRGADRTGVPLSGDRTGEQFERLLAAAGLRRDEVFVTNAVLCNPRDGAGRNRPPLPEEVANCSGLLRATIEVVDPAYVVALGNVALRALRLIAPHDARLARDVGRLIGWNGRWLVPLYHPGARARIHRPVERQIADFVRLGECLRRLDRRCVDQMPSRSLCHRYLQNS
ncbi:MAG: uracil-DNA glycosylase [Thermomicrobiales bacterium]